mmetsp:Transcript_2707/g.4600  ORF Transcript_2707/g.4600 Transcript_2707/m.4600 type:complete len:390 (+) Transcript_2707:2-1171(+)
MLSQVAVELTKKLEAGKQCQDEQKSADAIQIYEYIIAFKFPSEDDINDDSLRAKEQAAYRLGQIFSELSLFDQLVDLTKQILPLYSDLPKSKTGKIIRTLFDQCLRFPGRNRYEPLIELSKHIIEWCVKESRSFLRMKLENKLADLYFKQGKCSEALQILNKLLFELKKKDDKQLILESQLVESKVYHALENLPKAKSSLTSVKTVANSIYVVPMLQAEIDFMSGLISADERDYNTAYSYFYETFEGYRSMNQNEMAANAFKFMLFSKVMSKQPDDAINLINSSVSLKFQSRHVEAMKQVALASKQQNLLMFEKCKQVYDVELLEDPVIKRHFNYLYNTLLEDNLKKIIEPYSEVQIDFVAESIGLPMERILQKLSEMILDEVIDGTLD